MFTYLQSVCNYSMNLKLDTSIHYVCSRHYQLMNCEYETYTAYLVPSWSMTITKIPSIYIRKVKPCWLSCTLYVHIFEVFVVNWPSTKLIIFKIYWKVYILASIEEQDTYEQLLAFVTCKGWWHVLTSTPAAAEAV